MHSNSRKRTLCSSSPNYTPRQDRSRATRDRILGALVRLLDGKAFDQISVADLTEAARCSTSSFYARFPTKDSLFSALLDRFFNTSTQLVSDALSNILLTQATAEDRTRALVEFVLHSYREYRGLLRALIDYNRRYPESGFGSRTRAHKREMSVAMFGILLDDDLRKVDERTVESLRFTLWLVVQAIEQIVLFDNEMAGQGRIADELLVQELTAVLYRKLPHRRAGRTRRSST